MCGIALIRLRKPLDYYFKKYQTHKYGLQKLYLLMQKQHNRGQNGVGVANIKLDVQPGNRYISRYKSMAESPIEDIFNRIKDRINPKLEEAKKENKIIDWIKNETPFIGELYLGHLRYGTHGGNSLENCHPFHRQNNWRSRNLVLAGNFNLTNVDELFNKLLDLGQHPKDKVDTVIAMEKIGHFLDEANEEVFRKYRPELSHQEITPHIENELNLQRILERSCRDFDGGYAMAGLLGFGSSFVVRDPHGIRPAYYYANDEIVVAASEKPAIKTAFGIEYSEIQEIKPGHALIINKNGDYSEDKILEPKEKVACTFERIYFSRSSDPTIYNERKKLGELLCPQILKEIDYDLENTVFSYIPNTAESSFLGMMKGMESYLVKRRVDIIKEGKIEGKNLEKILSFKPRVEKLAIKDKKLRTFIANDAGRKDLVANAYDTTYEVINKHTDTIVLIDDSIVRGTTLEESILKMLDRLEPKKIVIVSSAPQIRYPDCYGIDMSKIGEFIAFRAAKALLKETGRENLLDDTYEQCLMALKKGQIDQENFVKEIYKPFTKEQISDKIADIITTGDIKADVKVIYQSVENLHLACPNHSGDWYFTGNYPTKGGNRVVNQAFVNFMGNKATVRAY